MHDIVDSSIPVTLYGNLEKYNNTISRGRMRTFYKGLNRNRTYITPEFAEKLISSAPYAPVKGIYDAEDGGDYTDHGKTRNQGRIYGVVPENPNFAWETHEDEDGVSREYACFDVLLYTALYDEANKILGKGQSMELYDKSIRGDWKYVDGKKCFEFSEGCFLGFQVLGDAVEPCFEGASFFTLKNEYKALVKDINQNFQKEDDNKMELFKLSDNQKERALFDLLNSEVDDEGYRIFAYAIMEVYDDYAIALNMYDCQYQRVYYTKNDENDSIEITKREKCYIVDVNESELEALKKAKTSNNYTFDGIDEIFTKNENLVNENADLVSKNTELESIKATLETEKNNLTSEFTRVSTEFDSYKNESEAATAALKDENEKLSAFKKQIEENEKFALIEQYSEFISDEDVENFKSKVGEFTATDLEKELALVSVRGAVFKKQAAEDVRLPKNNTPIEGIELILSRYEKDKK